MKTLHCFTQKLLTVLAQSDHSLNIILLRWPPLGLAVVANSHLKHCYMGYQMSPNYLEWLHVCR